MIALKNRDKTELLIESSQRDHIFESPKAIEYLSHAGANTELAKENTLFFASKLILPPHRKHNCCLKRFNNSNLKLRTNNFSS
jgi:hypothetical protein